MVLIIGWEGLGMEFVFVSPIFYSSYFEYRVLANKRKQGFSYCTVLEHVMDWVFRKYFNLRSFDLHVFCLKIIEVIDIFNMQGQRLIQNFCQLFFFLLSFLRAHSQWKFTKLRFLFLDFSMNSNSIYLSYKVMVSHCYASSCLTYVHNHWHTLTCLCAGPFNLLCIFNI